jgi:hypothetical protein
MPLRHMRLVRHHRPPIKTKDLLPLPKAHPKVHRKDPDLALALLRKQQLLPLHQSLDIPQVTALIFPFQLNGWSISSVATCNA